MAFQQVTESAPHWKGLSRWSRATSVTADRWDPTESDGVRNYSRRTPLRRGGRFRARYIGERERLPRSFRPRSSAVSIRLGNPVTETDQASQREFVPRD